MNNIKPIPPFKGWVIQNFPFIEADFDAITNYQLYCKIVEYLNKVISNENELITAMNYVLNYFNNLDVQEEIDNKLDEMAESGELSDIIAQYLQLAGVLAYDTLTDLVNAENITEGSICKTLGNSLINDGKGRFYKIRTITSDDVIDGFNIVALNVSNTLIAEVIKENNIIYFDNVDEMKTGFNLLNGTICKTAGYYNANDGGGAFYKIRTKTNDDVIDNSFIINITTTLVAELIKDNINILQLGAKNDNTSDISSILNNAINKLDYILIPSGIYVISDDINLKANINIVGEGQVSLLISNDAQIILNSNENSNYSVNISNITFRFNGNRTNYGIDLKDLVYSKLENCTFRSDDGTTPYNGIRLIGVLGNNYDNIISHCFFQKSALTLENSTDNFITDNKIWANDITGSAITLIDNCGNTLIKGNHIIGGTYGGIQSLGNEKILMRILNNYFDGRQRGICGTTYTNCTISNNTFFNMLDNPIEIQQLFASNVSNNSFYLKDLSYHYHNINISYNHGGNVFSSNTHYRNNTGTGNLSPYSFSENNPIAETLVMGDNCSYTGEFPNQESFTEVVFKNCYPTALFPN